MTDQKTSMAINQNDIDRLRYAGLIGADRYLAALRLVRDQDYWSRWGRRALLALGLSQFLSGIVFFFAYNWAELSDFAKFAVVEGAIGAAILGAIVSGEGGVARRSFLIVATILLGVLLAIVGQTYQTGADAFELFLAWSVLALPWALAGRSAALWCIWFVLAALALSLYCEQVLVTLNLMTDGQVSTVTGLVACFALGAREAAVASGCQWLASRWTRLLPIGIALVMLFGSAGAYVVDFYLSDRDLVCAVVFVIFLCALFYVYRRILPDYAALVAGIGFADLIFIALGIRVIDETIGFDFFDTESFFAACGLMILWAGTGTGLAAVLMRRWRPKEQGETA